MTQVHLQQLSAAQRARLPTESADQRQARLLQISAAQIERRAAETVAETEARLDRDREKHRAQRRVQPQPSLLEQPVVRHKMSAFHRHLSKVEVAQCITCCETFPGLRLQSLQSAECVRCFRAHVQFTYMTVHVLQTTLLFYSLLRLAPLMIIICL